MSDSAITVSGLGKRYRIGAQQQMYRTLREKLNDKAMAPFRAARQLLTRNGHEMSNGELRNANLGSNAEQMSNLELRNANFSSNGNSQPARSDNSQSEIRNSQSGSQPAGSDNSQIEIHNSKSGSQPARSENSQFEIRNSKSDTIWALRDVSFEIRRGEVVGIIGRNGAGKSTLLKILSRITEPTEGYADINGRIASLLEVGTGFHPELTGRENIFLNGSILGMKNAEIKQKFDEIVAFAEVEKFIDTPVKYYSSGMYVRLAFAVAAHLDPEILLVDEVLAVGDAAFQKKCLGKMGDVASEGRTVLFVSHNMAAVEAICSDALLLSGGKLVDGGKAAAIVKSYLGKEGTNEIHRRSSDALQWLGIANRKSLDELRPNDDVNLQFEFEATKAIRGLHVDCAILNEHGQNIIHTKSKFVSRGFHLPGEQRFVVDYRISSPKLAPGSYNVTVYAYSEEGELVWIEGIDAFRVTGKPYFGLTEYYDDVRSAILPEFDITLQA